MGDILESFFKSTNYLRPNDASSFDRMQQWVACSAMLKIGGFEDVESLAPV